MTSEFRATVLADLSACKEMADTRDAISARYAPPTDEDDIGQAIAQEVAGIPSNLQPHDVFVFGKDRGATEDAIRQKFALKAETLVSYQTQKSDVSFFRFECQWCFMFC